MAGESKAIQIRRQRLASHAGDRNRTYHPYPQIKDTSNKENNLPPYSDVPKMPNTNPYHAGYDQPGNQNYMPAPQGAMMMQSAMQCGPNMPSNVVVVTNQPQPTAVISRTRGSDLTVPSIVVCFFCCWVTGIPAILYALKAQNEYRYGDWDEAERSQGCARGWMISSVVIPVVFWILVLILYFTVLYNYNF